MASPPRPLITAISEAAALDADAEKKSNEKSIDEIPVSDESVGSSKEVKVDSNLDLALLDTSTTLGAAAAAIPSQEILEDPPSKKRRLSERQQEGPRVITSIFGHVPTDAIVLSVIEVISKAANEIIPPGSTLEVNPNLMLKHNMID